MNFIDSSKLCLTVLHCTVVWHAACTVCVRERASLSTLGTWADPRVFVVCPPRCLHPRQERCGEDGEGRRGERKAGQRAQGGGGHQEPGRLRVHGHPLALAPHPHPGRATAAATTRIHGQKRWHCAAAICHHARLLLLCYCRSCCATATMPVRSCCATATPGHACTCHAVQAANGSDTPMHSSPLPLMTHPLPLMTHPHDSHNSPTRLFMTHPVTPHENRT